VKSNIESGVMGIVRKSDAVCVVIGLMSAAFITSHSVLLVLRLLTSGLKDSCIASERVEGSIDG
jgi:hypothetical protein